MLLACNQDVFSVQESGDVEVSCMEKCIQKGSCDVHSFHVILEATQLAGNVVNINGDPTKYNVATKIEPE